MLKAMVHIYILLALSLLHLPLNSAALVRSGQPPAEEIVCVFDFNRRGPNAGMDWLHRGLADMMMTTMNRVSPYRVIHCPHLNTMLGTHGLAANGFAMMASANTAAVPDKADYFILGNFERQHATISIEVRLLRMTDRELLSTATWEGHRDLVTSAPRALSATLLDKLNKPFDARLLQGVEKHMPTNTDSAAAFYNGLTAFDRGKHAESLAYFLDVHNDDRTFIRINQQIIRVYDLLGEAGNAVRFARDIAQSLERSDVQEALSFYFTAAEKCLISLDDPKQAITILERMVELASQFETRTHEAEQTKQLVQDRALALYDTEGFKSPLHALAHRELRYRLWYREINDQLKEMQKANDYQWVRKSDQWLKVPIPDPSVWMWKLRAQLTLARLYVKANNLRKALTHYSQISQDYAFARHLSVTSHHSGFYWTDSIQAEYLLIALSNYKKTGKLMRDAFLMSALNEVISGSVFERTFKNLDRDPRAVSWSRREDGGHEYFHFVAPEGYQIDAVTLDTKIHGLAKFSVEQPDMQRWPPQIDKSNRLQTLTFFEGTHTKKIGLSAGTSFFSLNTKWGVRWADTQMEFYRGMGGKSPDQSDIIWWRATFHVSPISPKKVAPVVTP